MPVGPIGLRPIDKLAIAVGAVVGNTTMPAATNVGAAHPTSGYHVITNRSNVEIYYIDVTHPRSERRTWQDAFVERMQPLLVARFGGDRVSRRDRSGRKGFVIEMS